MGQAFSRNRARAARDGSADPATLERHQNIPAASTIELEANSLPGQSERPSTGSATRSPDDRVTSQERIDRGSPPVQAFGDRYSGGSSDSGNFLSSTDDSSDLNSAASNDRVDISSSPKSSDPCPKKPPNTLVSMVKSRWKQLLFVLSISLFAVFGLTPFFTSRISSPSPFLFKSTRIVDYSNGDLTKLSLKILDHEVSFVMYYAPWDMDCIRFAKQYGQLASFYKGQIFFAAINCWWPNGECAKVMRLKRFPIFLAHIRDVGDIEYRGPLVLSYVMPFLDNLLDPVVPLHHPGDLLELRSKHDAVLVRYCDFRTNSQPISYSKLLSGSIKALSFDPWRKLQFAVVNSRKLASKLRVSRSNSLYLFLWNGTFEKTFDEASDFDENIFKWIYETINHRGSLVEWVTSSGIKSNLMSNILTQQTTLMLFTPRTLIHGTTPYYELLREIAMDYYSCDKTANFTKSLIHRNILRRHLMKDKLLELEEWCHEKQYPVKPVSPANNDSCCALDSVKWFHVKRSLEKKCLCKVCAQVNMAKYPSAGQNLECDTKAKSFLRWNLLPESLDSIDFCEELHGHIEPKYTPYISFDFACTGNFSMATSKAFASSTASSPSEGSTATAPLATGHGEGNVKESTVKDGGLNGFTSKSLEVDHETTLLYSNLNLLDLPLFKSTVTDDHIRRMVQSLQEQYCSKLELGLSYSDFAFPTEGKHPTPEHLAMASAVKSGEQSTPSQRHSKEVKVNSITGLGCHTNKTLKFIAIDSVLYPAVAESMGINIQNETHDTALVISDKTTDSLYLLNVNMAKLNGYSDVRTVGKHLITDFIVNYTSGTLPKFLRSQEGTILSSEACLSMTSENVLCVPELTTRTFEPIISDDSKDVVVMYYTSWCGFCASISHIYLTVANFFRGVRGLAFTRVNVDTNELPALFSVDRIPTIALFPAKRKSESLIFPSNMPITTTSLVQFIIANSQPIVKWQTSFQLCDGSCLLRNLNSYTSQLRKLHRSLKVTKDTIRRLQVSLFWPDKFRHGKHQIEQEGYMKHLKARLTTLNLAQKSLSNLMDLLLRRIGRFTLLGKNDLTHDLLTDMLMLIKSPQQELRDRRKDRKRKKGSSKSERRKKEKELPKKDEL